MWCRPSAISFETDQVLVAAAVFSVQASSDPGRLEHSVLVAELMQVYAPAPGGRQTRTVIADETPADCHWLAEDRFGCLSKVPKTLRFAVGLMCSA